VTTGTEEEAHRPESQRGRRCVAEYKHDRGGGTERKPPGTKPYSPHTTAKP